MDVSSIRPFLRCVLTLCVLVASVASLSTMRDHTRHIGNNVVYPDEYLNHLGYLDDGHGTWVHTRKERKAAIRFYQKENNLPETGKIDKSTWQLMKTPRCAVPDVGDISTGPASGRRYSNHRRKRAANPEPNVKAKQVHPNDPHSYKWTLPHLTWRPSSLGHMISVDKQKSILAESFRRWSEPARIVVTQTYGEPEIDINFGRREHGDGRGNAFDGKGMLLAHAFPPGDLDISGDIHFDSDEPWSVDKNSPDTRDLMMIAMHEAGHSLGLPHSKNRNDIMYPIYLDYDPDPQLSRGDVKQLQKLYGKKPGYVMPRRKRKNKNNGNTRRMRVSRRQRFRMNRNLPRHCKTKFNAVVVGPNKEGYIFMKKQVYRLNAEGVLPGYPVHVHHEFPKAPTNPTTVFYVHETRKFYFFKGKRIWRFNVNHTLDEGYPMQQKVITSEKPTAAIVLRDPRGRSMAFFFSNKYTWRWNFYSEIVSGHYMLKTRFWKGLPEFIDAAVEWVDNYIYFFQHNKYYKISKRTKVVLDGYPQYKGSSWLGGDCGEAPK